MTCGDHYATAGHWFRSSAESLSAKALAADSSAKHSSKEYPSISVLGIFMLEWKIQLISDLILALWYKSFSRADSRLAGFLSGARVSYGSYSIGLSWPLWPRRSSFMYS